MLEKLESAHEHQKPFRGTNSVLNLAFAIVAIMMCLTMHVSANPGLRTCNDVEYAFLSYYDASDLEPEYENSPFSGFASILKGANAKELCKYIKKDWLTDGIISGTPLWTAYFVDSSGRTNVFTFDFPNTKRVNSIIGNSNAMLLRLFVRRNTKTSTINAALRRKGMFFLGSDETSYPPDDYDTLYDWKVIYGATFTRSKSRVNQLCGENRWLIQIDSDDDQIGQECVVGVLDSLRKAGRKREDSAKKQMYDSMRNR